MVDIDCRSIGMIHIYESRDVLPPRASRYPNCNFSSRNETGARIHATRAQQMVLRELNVRYRPITNLPESTRENYREFCQSKTSFRFCYTKCQQYSRISHLASGILTNLCRNNQKSKIKPTAIGVKEEREI